MAASVARIQGTDFRPAKLHLPTLRLWNALLPFLLRRFCEVSEVVIPDTDIARLQALRGERLLLTPNHPTNADPALLFALGKAANIPFHYLACRETFDNLGGLWGRIIQNLGAYSVVRGTADRESFRMTRRILASPGGKVVIFPEGEVYSQNDTLLPFQSGVTQLAFWALEDLQKAGETTANVSLLPVAVRYTFVEDMSKPIVESLVRLEWSLRRPDIRYRLPEPADPYTRLRQIGIAMLETLEDEYGLKAGMDTDNLTPRMNALKAMLLDRAAALIGVRLSPDSPLPERMRTLINAVYAVTHEEPDAPRSPYRARLHRQQAARVAPLMQDLNRVANWIAVQDDYVRARPTPERMADTLRRLEVEAFGKPRLHGPRRALVRVGDPLPLAPCFAAYRADKRAAIARVTEELEGAVQGLLDEPHKSK